MAAANLADMLAELFGSPEIRAKIASARSVMQDVSGGNPATFLRQVDMARGAAEGAPDPRVAASFQTPEDLAIADRVAWGRMLAETEPAPTGGLSLLPTIGYEGLKAAATTNPGAATLKTLGNVFGKLGGATGNQLADWFTIDATSSPASLGNIAALLHGYYGQ